MRRQVDMAYGRRRGVPESPDVRLLEGVVSDTILNAMRLASTQLASRKIRHALVGALAVGAHGYPRATRDVDFLVGEEAFDHFEGGIVTVAPGVPIAVGTVAVDPISIAPGEEHLEPAIDSPIMSANIPVAPLKHLIYMKLRAPRQKDAADVVELLKAGMDPKPIRSHLAEAAPDLLGKFDALIARADEES